MLESLQQVPFVGPLLTAALAAAALEIVVLVRARRQLLKARDLRRRALAGHWSALANLTVPSRAGEIAAAVAPFVVAAIAVSAIDHARALMSLAVRPTTPLDETATLMSQGISAEFSSLPFALWLVLLLVTAACFAVGFAVTARLRTRGLVCAAAAAPDSPARNAWATHPGPSADVVIGSTALLLGLGLGPIIQSAFAYLAHIIRGFRDLAGVDPSWKAELWARLLTQSRADLSHGWLEARVGLAMAIGVTSAIAIAASPARRRARLLGQPAPVPGNGDLRLIATFAAVAAVTWAASLPMQRENETPWPPPSRGNPRPSFTTTFIDLDGPDPVEPAPTIELSADELKLSGRHIELGELGDSLEVLRNNHDLLHPGQRFNQLFALACSLKAPASAMNQVLAAGSGRGYRRTEMLFLHEERVSRPVLGTLVRHQATAARFAIVDRAADAEEGSTLVKTSDARTCAELAARIVGLRQAGKQVAVLVGS
jgi:hypothetical protein